MDPELLSTVEEGDVKNLIKLCATHSQEFFLAQENKSNSNVFHILCKGEKQACIEEALRRLPTQVVRQLICQTDSNGSNPLHVAAAYGFPSIAQLLVDSYKSSDDGVDLPSSDDGVDLPCLPWTAKNKQGKLPVQVAVASSHDEVSAFLLSSDPDFPCDAGSLLRDSAVLSCPRTVRAILTSGVKYSIKDIDPYCIVKLSKNCPERDVIVLLERHQELIKCQDFSGKLTILRCAIEHNLVDIIKTILNIDISVAYTRLVDDGPHPLHIATRLGRHEIAQLLIDAFHQSFKRQIQREREAAVRIYFTRSFEIKEDLPAAASLLSTFQPPWRQTDTDGATPLHEALVHGHTELAAFMLSRDLALLSDLADAYEEPPIVPVVEQKGFREATDRCLDSDVKHNFMALYLDTFLQFLRENPDNKTRQLILQHPKLIEFKDASGRAILHCLLDHENDVHIMRLLLNIHPSAVDHIQDGEQEHLLIKACRKGNLPAIHVICAACPQAVHRHGQQTTALHNVKLQDLEEYRSLLEIPQISRFKNRTDALGRSPLMKAIQDDDVHLAQALLEMEGIDVMGIKSNEGKTAVNMLKDKSRESNKWGILYQKAKATAYVGANLNDLNYMKNSCMGVVAALLATITFTAAFTVPGGFDQNNGDVLLGRRASFIVFILSDTCAMCCSMFVLYFLSWSVESDVDKFLLVIDLSTHLLSYSLNGTMVAFIAGVYTVMSHKSLWVTIVIAVLGSCVLISSNRNIMPTILDIYAQIYKNQRSPELKEVFIQD